MPAFLPAFFFAGTSLAADERGSTLIEKNCLIRVHRRSLAAYFFTA
jgi:hypothetical protein